MKTQIRKRYLKGYKLTKKQLEWIKEEHDPRFDQTCGHCLFNLELFLDLV